MADMKTELALSFLRSHADDGARALEALPAEECAQFVAALPPEDVAGALIAMLPQYAARIFNEMDSNTAAAFLARMEPGHVAAVLRYVDRRSRRSILDKLPDRLGSASRLLLNYTENMVGAWMDARVSTLPEECTVGEALARLSGDSERVNAGTVYVISRDRRLRGAVSVPELLRVAPERPLSATWNAAPEPLLARSTLLSVRDNPVWKVTDLVPVVSRSRQLVGTLSHASLRHGLAQMEPTIREPVGADAATGIWEVYGTTLLTLFDSFGELAGDRTRSGGSREP